MGRLIDADAFIEYVNRRYDLCSDELRMMIDEQPTAYDIENVVAELEYQKEKCEEDMAYWHEKSWKDSIAYTNWDLCNRKSNDLEEIIDLVRKGGAE